jgi:hypothetical protein
LAKIKIVIDERGRRLLLQDPDIHAQLRDVAGVVARKAGSDWSVQDWNKPPSRGRKTRTVVNVINNKPSAAFEEARKGRMSRILKGFEQ